MSPETETKRVREQRTLPAHRYWTPWGIRFLLVLVSAEISLQLISVGYRWWAARIHVSPVTDPDCIVLCLGDS